MKQAERAAYKASGGKYTVYKASSRTTYYLKVTSTYGGAMVSIVLESACKLVEEKGGIQETVLDTPIILNNNEGGT